MKHTVNGKKVTEQELEDLLNDEDTAIERVSIGFDADSDREQLPLSHEGFAIEQEFISSFSETMSETNASIACLHMKRSPKIYGRSMMVIMYEPEKQTWLQKLAFWLLNKSI